MPYIKKMDKVEAVQNEVGATFNALSGATPSTSPTQGLGSSGSTASITGTNNVTVNIQTQPVPEGAIGY